MDANKFMAEYKRMCASYDDCRDCPLNTDNGQCTEIPSRFTKEFIDKVTKTVEDWSVAHPRKTRQEVFLEQWPETRIEDDGVLTLCPILVSSTYRNQDGSCKTPCVSCDDCCREFWMQEVE